MLEYLARIYDLFASFCGKSLALLIAATQSIWFFITSIGAIIAFLFEIIFDFFDKVLNFVEAVNSVSENGLSTNVPPTMLIGLRWVSEWWPVQLTLDYIYVLFVGACIAYTIRAFKAWIPTVN